MKKLSEMNWLAGLAAVLVAVSPLVGGAQTRMPFPADPPAAIEPASEKGRLPYGGVNDERSIKVDPNVNFNLCVVQGNLRINGWKRDEIRIFVRDGSRVNFRVKEKDPKTETPVWVAAIGYDPKKVNKAFPDCLWGEEIEIDLPHGATIAVTGQETRASADSVKKVTIKNAGGDISVRNISYGVSATTYRGDITLANSRGPIGLESTTGNIVVFEAGPSGHGDPFKAKTNSGAITLQQVEHRQIEAGSISGSILFSGRLLGGGTYAFTTSNGSIRLALPADASSRITASYGYGSFASDIPIRERREEPIGPIKTLTGLLGKGDLALLRLVTNSGMITIRRQ